MTSQGFYTDIEYYEYLEGCILSNINSLKKVKPHKRPPGVYQILNRLLTDTQLRLQSVKSGVPK